MSDTNKPEDRAEDTARAQRIAQTLVCLNQLNEAALELLTDCISYLPQHMVERIGQTMEEQFANVDRLAALFPKMRINGGTTK